VTYRDLPIEAYTATLHEAGLDRDSAAFVAALDASLARGDLETDRHDLARLLGRPPTPLDAVVRAAHHGAHPDRSPDALA
jgi:NAD(P)H dehydrogenase (quinone)